MSGTLIAASTAAGPRRPNLGVWSPSGDYSFLHVVAAPVAPWCGVSLHDAGQLSLLSGTGLYPTSLTSSYQDPQWSGVSGPVTGYGNMFEGRLDVVSGQAPTAGISSSTGTWLPLNTERRWIMQGVSGPSSRSGTWRISIRSGSVLVSQDYLIACNSV
jgi:hypothetical protein